MLPSESEGESITMSLSHSPDRGSAFQQSTHQHLTQDVTAARTRAKRAKLNAQTQARKTTPQSEGKKTREAVQGRTQTSTSIVVAIDEYLQNHEGGNNSHKTLEWHATALGLL